MAVIKCISYGIASRHRRQLVSFSRRLDVPSFVDKTASSTYIRITDTLQTILIKPNVDEPNGYPLLFVKSINPTVRTIRR